MTDREMLEDAAIVLAGEVSQWTINNMDCYPRVQMWRNIVVHLGLPYDAMKKAILEHKLILAGATLVTEQYLGRVV